MNEFLPNPNKSMLSEKEYNYINSIFKDSNIYFMNHGYVPTYTFLDKYFINEASLYCRLIDGIETENKTILDIGCGRGGGVYTYNKYFNFKEIYGCDLNKMNIDFCIKNHSNKIKFNQYSAEKTKYNDKQFDIITNLESSHDYEDIVLFFEEIKRILKDGGIFIYADIFYDQEELDYVVSLLYNNFHEIEALDITENVKNSCIDNLIYFDEIQDEEIRLYLKRVATNHFIRYNTNRSKYILARCKGKK